MTTNGATPTSCFAWRCSSKVFRMGRQLASLVSAALFPPKCALCSSALESSGILCSECVTRLPLLAEPRCQRCAEPLDDPSVDLCLRCGVTPHAADRILALGPYHGEWGALVRIFKFEREVGVGRWLGHQMADAIRSQQEQLRLDAVTYVPMMRRDRHARGFNQAQVLARIVATQLDLPMRRLLAKSRGTRLQARLSAADRRTNLQDAFRPLPFEYERVLLVDDIYTTGSTVEECARTLKRGGAQYVVAATIARA